MINDQLFPRDDDLRQYSTDRQWEVLETYWRCGSQQKAADALGIAKSTVDSAIRGVRRRASRQGHRVESHTRDIPDGYKLRGVSTLVDRRTGESVMEWVKTSEDRDRQLELVQELIEGFREDVGRAEPIPPPRLTLDDHCTIYPVGDHHFGMYAWDEEAGGNYDLGIAERLLDSAAAELVSVVPQTRYAVLALMGDLFHYDSLQTVTPKNRNLLDSDSRFAQVTRAVRRSVQKQVRRLLGHHQQLHVIALAGNHDESSMVIFREMLAGHYEDEPRVVVCTSPSQFQYYRFGRNLEGFCHGHEVKKLEDLPLIMATDRPADWGETRYRHWTTGHTHKLEGMDVQGVKVERVRVLPPTDAWAHNVGYRSGREMIARLLHAEYGERQRSYANPDMFK